MYHKPESHKYNRALCGASVGWKKLAMNEDMVECKNCKRIIRKQEEKHEYQTSN